MKKILLFSLTAILHFSLSFSQESKENKELYPDTYTFKKAKSFERKKEYQKAIWFYINLMPLDKERVLKEVKEIKVKLDTINMAGLINSSFLMFVSNDPVATVYINGNQAKDWTKVKDKVQWADELKEKVMGIETKLNSAEEYYARGLEKSKTFDYKEAASDFSKAIEMKPKGEYYYNRAFAKNKMYDYYGAMLDYSKAIELNYNVTNACLEKGNNNDLLNNRDSAIQDYSRAIEANGQNAEAYYKRGVVFSKQKNRQEALTDFDKAIALQPDYKEAYANRGIVKKALGKKEEACADWIKAVQLGFLQAQMWISDNCNIHTKPAK